MDLALHETGQISSSYILVCLMGDVMDNTEYVEASFDAGRPDGSFRNLYADSLLVYYLIEGNYILDFRRSA